ncbi:MAG: IMP dehydrogenase [Bacteroidales bacterium]|nr:IMP dehydrogenase [Bacteroidales bacterium]
MSFTEDRICQDAITFDDVLLAPAYSEVLPSEVSTRGRFSRNITLELPFASAAMDTVTEAPMAIAMARAGGIGVIHKNLQPDDQARAVAQVKAEGLRVAAAVGVGAFGIERAAKLCAAGVDAIVLDSAHGHSKGIIDTLKILKEKFPDTDIVAGNIATADAARALIAAGADGLKVGIGPGSICTTRIVAGIGVPQLTAIYDVYCVAREFGIPVIADGGLRYSGDIVKALACGGDCVMCGSLLAGTEEAPGYTEMVDGCMMKSYRGMGSLDAMKAGSADRYFQSGSKKLVPEGVVAWVPCKGPVADVLFQLAGGLRAGMGYCGARDFEALHKARFVRISAASLRENHPHDVIIAKKAPNYE